MTGEFMIANFKHVANGLQEGQFAVGGERVTQQLDRIWTKYPGNPPPYGLRDPAIDEKRVMFVCCVDRIATFRVP